MSGYLLDSSGAGLFGGCGNSTVSVKIASKDLSLDSFCNAAVCFWLSRLFGWCRYEGICKYFL